MQPRRRPGRARARAARGQQDHPPRRRVRRARTASVPGPIAALNLADAAAQAQAFAEAGDERAIAKLRRDWDDELEGAARNPDYRIRAIAYRGIGQFRYRQKLELLARGLEDESPACRGSALVSLELLSRESPGVVNSNRRTLHDLATTDSNGAVRRLAIVCLKNGTAARETIALLRGLADNDDEDKQLRELAEKIAAALQKKANVEANARRSGGR